jgi:hypothetical protein
MEDGSVVLPTHSPYDDGQPWRMFPPATTRSPKRFPAGATLPRIAPICPITYELVSATNHYYGNLLPKRSVLNEKAAFFEKWPVRNYSVRADSVTVTCKTGFECRADGVLDWQVSGHILSSKGSLTFSLVWYLEDGNWKIASEATWPIDRKSIDAPAASAVQKMLGR